ncbi:hypothetical protein KCP78_22850 [Salmonella enterica subsp. enterica]|nr:hypothetical protein KCP78_22850 [Salmonella enterica subsp. enterica]
MISTPSPVYPEVVRPDVQCWTLTRADGGHRNERGGTLVRALETAPASIGCA